MTEIVVGGSAVNVADKRDLLIGVSPQILKIREELAVLGRFRNTTVLFTGETGTGKEAAANFLHYKTCGSEHSTAFKLVVANLSAIPQMMIERELFGNERGAYTDASSMKIGLIEAAGKGTLFLDEIGGINDYMQERLMRLLDTRTYLRMGGTEEKKCLARLVVATNVDLNQAVANRNFKNDLYYRLIGPSISMPPLRERKEDIPLLAKHFLDKFLAENSEKVRTEISLPQPTINWLSDQGWPGNVRQLQRCLTTAVIRCVTRGRESIHIDDIVMPPEVACVEKKIDQSDVFESWFGIGKSPQDIRRDYALWAITKCGNQARAARGLKITRQALHKLVSGN